MPENPVNYIKLPQLMVAFLPARINRREEIPPLLERLKAGCGEYVCGEAMAIFHSGAVKDGFLVEAAYPVSSPAECGEIHTRTLEPVAVLSMLHRGSHESIRETIQKIHSHLSQHALTTSLIRREIYRVLNASRPEENVTEVQVILHEWDRLLAEGTQAVLGMEARRLVMQGIETLSPESSSAEYTAWIQEAMERLDALTGDSEKKCQVVSHCAHRFPEERITHLRTIYENGTFDDILHEMYADDFWYEKPVRRGNVIHMRKNPYNPEGYANATSPAERRKAYCHCAFVRPFLDIVPSQLSATFCYCGAGWYRQLWEGILQAPVKIEQVETLLKGDDQCRLTITLPLELAGQCSPEG
jgi:effector-binding domain-containing protein